MKILLTIGHTDILLPDDSGITTVLKVLSKGVRVYDRLYDGRIEFEGHLQVGMKTVPPGTKFTGLPKSKADKPELLTLNAPKDILL